MGVRSAESGADCRGNHDDAYKRPHIRRKLCCLNFVFPFVVIIEKRRSRKIPPASLLQSIQEIFHHVTVKKSPFFLVCRWSS